MQDVRKEGVVEMKITCTQEEKDQLIMVFVCGFQCPFAETVGHGCDGTMECRDCVEQGIEWELTERGEQK